MCEANDDFFGESDPYVTLTVGAQTKETEVIFNNCRNPIWERSFYIFNALSSTLGELYIPVRDSRIFVRTFCKVE